MSLEGVVKSDSSVEQKTYFVRGLQRRSQTSIKESTLFEKTIVGKVVISNIGIRVMPLT